MELIDNLVFFIKPKHSRNTIFRTPLRYYKQKPTCIHSIASKIVSVLAMLRVCVYILWENVFCLYYVSTKYCQLLELYTGKCSGGLLENKHWKCPLVTCTLSHHRHQIESMTHLPLFRVRLWNNGMRCVSFIFLWALNELQIRPPSIYI